MKLPSSGTLSASNFLGVLATTSADSAPLTSSESSCNDLHDCRTLPTIVLSCLATLVACTWVSVHPNVPGWNDSRITIAVRRLKLMIVAILAPEIIIVWAIRQRMVARHLVKAYSGMTMVHGFFVSMGGYLIDRPSENRRSVASHEIGTEVSLRDILDVYEIEISDRSKGDELSKGIAVLQTLWFLMQCIARRIQRLPLTELEIVTIAFASINVAIYIIWWHKPLDVRCPVRIGLRTVSMAPFVDAYQMLLRHEEHMRLNPPVAVPTKRRSLHQCVAQVVDDTINSILYMFAGEELEDQQNLPSDYARVPTLWAGRLNKRQRAIAAMLSVFVALCFGAIHFAAWNLAFPSRPEQILWRVATVAVVSVPFFFFVYAVIYLNIHVPAWISETVYYIVIPLGLITYILARTALIVLPFISLRSLPANVYRDIDWTTYIPHFS